jgi:hypothetical protein
MVREPGLGPICGEVACLPPHGLKGVADGCLGATSHQGLHGCKFGRSGVTLEYAQEYDSAGSGKYPVDSSLAEGGRTACGNHFGNECLLSAAERMPHPGYFGGRITGRDGDTECEATLAGSWMSL